MTAGRRCAVLAWVVAAALTAFATREDLVDGLQRGQVLAVILRVLGRGAE